MFWAFAATLAAIKDLPVASNPAISEILPTGIPASFPLQTIESSHLEPVGIHSFTWVGLLSWSECATSLPAFLLIMPRIEAISSAPFFSFDTFKIYI